VIATSPVARWTWGRFDQAGDKIVVCLRDLLNAYAVLAEHRLAVGAPRVSVSVHEAGRPKSELFDGGFVLEAMSPPPDVAKQLAGQVESARRPGEVGGVSAHLKISGLVIVDGDDVLEESLFSLRTSAFLDYAGAGLETFSDSWMPYDLKGRAQPTVHAANAPRVAAALRSLSETLDSDIEPEDPTYFGEPTETGVVNRFRADGTPWDVWASLEIPARTEIFRHAPAFHPGYRRTADGAVQYVPVRGEHGVLGYLWASDTGNAASFEPRDAADEEGRQVGLVWLDRLRSVYERGLTPSQALTELAGLPEYARPSTLDLASLRELARES